MSRFSRRSNLPAPTTHLYGRQTQGGRRPDRTVPLDSPQCQTSPSLSEASQMPNPLVLAGAPR
ncbi:hypothetical protein DPMN_016559 [Dreissena polymorpha]|uniref:Uncharacterized protein n=1 Tax=Dreissena polymorpha TaxID=45954 RepID=A0A9D4S5L9_DREPO|nr:hypothetical protein DPMN_016559 [Dreissena polymorpha]